MRGRWSAQVLPATKNAANGSWTLFNESNQIVLEGTWSARKSAAGWQGTWSARIQGRNVSGTWTAEMPDFNGKTFEDMLKRTAEKQIGGSWQSGRAQGNWWLRKCSDGFDNVLADRNAGLIIRTLVGDTAGNGLRRKLQLRCEANCADAASKPSFRNSLRSIGMDIASFSRC